MYILSKAIHINVLYATNNVLMLSKVTPKVSRLSVPCIWRIKKSKSSLHQDCIDLKTKINSLETCWLPCQRIMPDMNCWSLFPSFISWYLPFLSHFFKIWGLAAWIGYFQYIFFLNEILGSNFHLDNQIKNIIDSKVATNIQSVWKTALYFNVLAWLGWAVSSAEQCWVVLSSAELWAWQQEERMTLQHQRAGGSQPNLFQTHSILKGRVFVQKKDARLLKSSAV